MRFHYLLYIILLFIFNNAQASFISTKDFHVAIGAEGVTELHKRGITTYGGYQVFPIYAIDLFNPNLQLVGSSLYYKLQFGDSNFHFRTRFAMNATKDEPLYVTTEEKTERVRRNKTNELDLYFEYRTKDAKYFRIQSSTDLKAHKGQYFEIFAQYPLFSFFKKDFLYLSLFSSVGMGNLKHNEYFYGLGAESSGLNNVEYGITITAPSAIDPYFPVVRLSRYHILGDKNKSASFVKEKQAWSLKALMAFRVF